MPNESSASIDSQTPVREQMRLCEAPMNEVKFEFGRDIGMLVRTIVAERFARPLEEIRPETRLAVDLGLDSLDMIEINIALEEQLHLPLPQVALPEEVLVETIQHLTDLVTARLAQHRAGRRASP